MGGRPPRALLSWAALCAPALAFVWLAVRGPLATVRLEAPSVAFAAILTLTALCLVGAVAVMALGWSLRLAEVTILGTALATASVLPLVHGLAMPGVLYGANTTVSVAAFLAVPMTLLVAAPLVLPRAALLRRAAVAWRSWSLGWLAVTVAVSAALAAAPRVLPAPSPGEIGPVTLAGVSLAGAMALSLRHLRLYRIGGRRASLAASVGVLYLGLSTLVWLGAAPYSAAWWGAHAADALGVLLAAAGLVVAHRRDGSLVLTLAPVVNRDPLVALELGLTPVVHRFVASLAQKDAVTRDHVVRVGELAMRTGLRAGLDPERLRVLGLGALLHDVGKLRVPAEILSKAGALTDEEFAVMATHTTAGFELMSSSPLLAPAAPLVRWHHERIDGTGYPDGLAGGAIPLEAGLISVCDAYDAMTYTRPYRRGMPAHEARRILAEGAGAQWDPRAVDLLTAELDENGPVAVPVYDRVGEGAAGDVAWRDAAPVCLDALPAPLRT